MKQLNNVRAPHQRSHIWKHYRLSDYSLVETCLIGSNIPFFSISCNHIKIIRTADASYA